MKQIKLSVLLVAVLACFSACTKREFTPVTGNTQVEFVNATTEVTLTGEYLYIPIQMVEQSTKAAKVTVSFDGGEIVMNEDNGGQTVAVLEDEQILITSKELYIGGYDPDVDGEEDLPTNSIEVRVPNYRAYQSITLRFSITSGNAAQNATTTFVAKAPEKGDVAGQYELASSLTGSSTIVTIIAVDEATYTLVGLFGPNNPDIGGFYGTYAEPTFTISNAANTDVTQEGEPIICCSFDGQYLNPEQSSTLTISPTGFTSDNGILVCFKNGEQYSYFFGCMPGDEAVRL